jgi:plasmid stabilization system protein ParE
VSFRLRFTARARRDLKQLYDFLLKEDPEAADEAMTAVEQSLALLERFPFACRSAGRGRYGAFVRELLVPFARAGYVLLFEVTDKHSVTILSARQQRETDVY